MKSRVFWIFFLILSTLLAANLVYFAFMFKLFKEDSKLIQEIAMQNYSVKIYHIPSDATIQSTIVVMKAMAGKDSLIAKFERFENLREFRIIGSDSLELILESDGLDPKKEFKTIVVLSPLNEN